MFVIELTYNDELVAAKEVGGVLLTEGAQALVGVACPDADVSWRLLLGQEQRIVQQDPLYTHGLADFRIIEFRASQRADDIQERMRNE